MEHVNCVETVCTNVLFVENLWRKEYCSSKEHGAVSETVRLVSIINFPYLYNGEGNSQKAEHLLRPVSTQENKHRIGLAFFHLVLSAPPDQKQLKILQLFIIRAADHRFELEHKIATESPCGFNSVFLLPQCPHCHTTSMALFILLNK